MEVILLGIYCTIVWLIFIKFKLLPWNTPWKVTVVIIPIVGLATLILVLNVVAPSSSDVTVVRYVVPIIPEARGRVVDVPIENNRHMKKGEVLFRIDPTPFEIAVRDYEARLQSQRADLTAASAALSGSEAGGRELTEELQAASGKVGSITAALGLARKRLAQTEELAATGAGSRFDHEEAQATVEQLTAELAAARASERQVLERLSGKSEGELASVAEARARVATASANVASTEALLADASWSLSQTTVFAPADGTVINLQLRPGMVATALGMLPVMSFVEDDYQVYALYYQNELFNVEPGDKAEIALETIPGRVIKATVDSVLWGQGQGQMNASGSLPITGLAPSAPGRFPVKLLIADGDKDAFLAAGAHGHAAIYTQHGKAVHIIRKVIIRVGSYTNYLVLKLH